MKISTPVPFCGAGVFVGAVCRPEQLFLWFVAGLGLRGPGEVLESRSVVTFGSRDARPTGVGRGNRFCLFNGSI